MAWVKLDDQARQHRKLLAAGPIGAWLWACSLMYCNSQKAKDGFIPEAAVPVLYPIPGWRREAIRLVSVGLWERVEGGYIVHDYHEYQPKSEEAERQREQKSAAGRVGGVRSGQSRRSKSEADREAEPEAEPKHAASTETKPVPIPSRPVPERSEIPEPGVEAQRSEKPRLTAFEEPFWKAAYGETVRETLQGSWSFPDRQARSIRAAIEGHCSDYANIDAWLRANVAAFVSATRERASYYAGLGPDGFAKWLNEQSALAPRAVPVVAAVSEPEVHYPPPTPEEAAELEQALRDMVDPTKRVGANVGQVRSVGEDLPPEDLERLEVKRRETVARLRAELAGGKSAVAS